LLPPEDRLEDALEIARETFKKTALTVKDIETAVKKARRKAYEDAKRFCRVRLQL